jgi:hypothetical protein
LTNLQDYTSKSGLVQDTCNFQPQGSQSSKVDFLGQKIHYA